jgi:hypothetical protein
MKLEDVIRKQLAEATAQLAEATQVEEAKKAVELKEPADAEEVGGEDKVDLKPTLKKELTKEDSAEVPAEVVAEDKPVKESKVSEQVSALLEAEGLSDEFKVQAVTIFEAAVTDRVLQIQEEMKQDFEAQLVEAKAQMETDIDGFLSEAVAKWHEENEVAIKSNFNTQVAESFMDGLSKLIAEHNIEVPTGKEDALATALSEVDKLNEELKARADEVKAIQETVKKLEAGKILESFKEKMTSTEFDRFTQLTETVSYSTEEQYKKQLSIVLENFGSKQKPAQAPKQAEIITEDVIGATKVETVTDSNVAKYAAFLTKR